MGGAVVTTATALTTPAPNPAFHQSLPLSIDAPLGVYGPRDPKGAPVRLLIPRLKLSAPVDALGVTRDYALQAPAGVSSVAWYRLGALPGNPGDAIISGHRGYPGGVPAVFNHLGRLKPGDEIEVLLAGGSTVRFAVDRIFSSPYRVIPAGFFATDGPSRLTLVTCTGTFRTNDLTYTDRLVVEATSVAGNFPTNHQGVN